MKTNNIINEDINRIYHTLSDKLAKAEGSTWLISGGAGFIGAYFMDLLHYCNHNVFKTPCKIICIENFITSVPKRIKHLEEDADIRILNMDVTKQLHVEDSIDYIVHAASIASPTFYRKYPIETIEANVTGLKNLLELARAKKVRSMLFFSTSEIYGNPDATNIPTPETYNGNVSCTGPRACYDESKRLGETFCVNYHQQYGVPVKSVRPFNVYGPGLRIDDRRVIPDFFNDAISNKKINILSNGAPTRSFCYITDAMCGFMSALLSEHDGEAFNIGNDEQEVSMKELAEVVCKIVGDAKIVFSESKDDKYLTDNPQRRCPDLSKAKSMLSYKPQISLEYGLSRLYEWYIADSV